MNWFGKILEGYNGTSVTLSVLALGMVESIKLNANFFTVAVD